MKAEAAKAAAEAAETEVAADESCSKVLRRARLHLNATPPIVTLQDVKQAMQHLLEALYCRRLTMWLWDAANRAVAA